MIEIRSMTYLDLLTEIRPKPISSNMEYERQLAIIDSLMMSEGSTPKSKARIQMVELLTTLVSAWEAQVSPASGVSPQEMLVHTLEAKGISQSQLAKELGVSRQLISYILKEERTISLEMAIKLASYFDHPIEFYVDRSSTRVA